MAKPIVYTDTSVQAYAQWDEFEFSPVALNDPTSWVMAGNLPPGTSFDTATGKISGTMTTQGLWQVNIWPVNADGQGGIPDSLGAVTALPLHIVFACWPTVIAPNSALNLEIDTQTGAVALTGDVSTLTGTDDDGAEIPLLFTVKEDDDRIIFVRFTAGGVYLDLSLDDLAYGLKADDTEKQLVASTASFVKVGAGRQTYYVLHVKFARALLAAALSDYENKRKTSFIANAEIQWKETNLGFAGTPLGNDPLIRTSRLFWHEVVRDIITS
jgi:hypothetical protein